MQQSSTGTMINVGCAAGGACQGHTKVRGHQVRRGDRITPDILLRCTTKALQVTHGTTMVTCEINCWVKVDNKSHQDQPLTYILSQNELFKKNYYEIITRIKSSTSGVSLLILFTGIFFFTSVQWCFAFVVNSYYYHSVVMCFNYCLWDKTPET